MQDNTTHPIRVDDATLKTCLCGKCGQYLSYPPIILQKNDYLHEECCDTSPEAPATARADAYEALASCLIFPCVNKLAGCEEHIQFGLNARDHINQCSHTPLPCPFRKSKTCTWMGGTLNLAEHFKESHPDFCLERAVFKIDCNFAQELHYLVVVDGVSIILQTKCDPEQKALWFNASSLPIAQDIPSVSYCIKLTPEGVLKPSLEIDTKPITPLTDTVMDVNLCEKMSLGILLKIFKTSSIDCCWTLTTK